MTLSTDTHECALLLQAKACSPGVARLLGLLFANRDIEMIEYLQTLTDLPAHEAFPSAETVAPVLAVEPRWAVFQLEKMHRFLRKREINGNFTSEIQNFSNRPEVQALAPACRKLKPGPTVFIGDSLMDVRNFSADANFPILAGGFLQSLGIGPYFNAGIGGETTAQGLVRFFDKDVLAHNPARVVLSFGGNDLATGVTLETIRQNFTAMIRPVQERGGAILLGLILPIITERLWWSPQPFSKATLEDRRPLQAAMLDLARRFHIPCFNLFDQFTPADFGIDGIHPNQSGQDRLALETLRLLTA